MQSIEGVNKAGKFIRVGRENLEFQYRSCNLPKNFIVTSVYVRPIRTKTDTIKKKMIEMLSRRKKTQPIKKATCGSTFKNPDGKSSLMLEEITELKAWRLIDKAGLRGKKIGRAMVSNKHPNFLINMEFPFVILKTIKKISIFRHIKPIILEFPGKILLIKSPTIKMKNPINPI